MIATGNQKPKPKPKLETTSDFADSLAKVTAAYGGNKGAALVMLANPGAMAWFYKGGTEKEIQRLTEFVLAEKAALAAVAKVARLMHDVPPCAERMARTAIFDGIAAELEAVVVPDTAALLKAKEDLERCTSASSTSLSVSKSAKGVTVS